MNHPHRTHPPAPDAPTARRLPVPTTILALLVALAAPAGLALAQRAGGGANLPKDLRSASDPGPRQGEIDKFVAAQVGLIRDGKTPAEQQSARDALIRQVNAPQVSPRFLAVYAAALNKQLLGLAKSPDPRARLNGAIALQRVAQKTSSSALAAAAAAFASDGSPGVALWGARAAQSILPAQAQSGKPNKLSAAVIEGARKHVDQPDFVDEAYRAVTLDFPSKAQQLTPAAVPAVLPDVLRLVETRVKYYVSGVPPSPRIDRDGAIFLTSGRVWGHAAAAKYHGQIAQALSDLVGLATQHAAARDDPEARRRYTDLLRQLGEALTVVSTAVKDPKLQAAAKVLTDVNANTANEQLAETAGGVFEALKARYPKLREAPIIEEGAGNETEPEEETATPAPAAAKAAARERAPADEEDADADGDVEE